MAQPQSGITVIRTADGSFYVLRPEILEACKVTEPESIQRLEQTMGEQDVRGFGIAGTQIATSFTAPISLTTQKPQIPNLGARASTVMCPDW